jgi:hypothetical protein
VRHKTKKDRLGQVGLTQRFLIDGVFSFVRLTVYYQTFDTFGSRLGVMG